MEKKSTIETACFATGWFWTPDYELGSVPGVIRTRVGYTGGRGPNPNYRNMQDHTESIQVDYDSSIVTYNELLDFFWDIHSPFNQSYGQYKHAVYFMNDQQKELAILSKMKLEATRKKKVLTYIEPMTIFTNAEDYHQKYYLRGEPDCRKLFSKLTAEQLRESTYAMLLNSHCGDDQRMPLKRLKEELKKLDTDQPLKESIIRQYKL